MVAVATAAAVTPVQETQLKGETAEVADLEGQELLLAALLVKALVKSHHHKGYGYGYGPSYGYAPAYYQPAPYYGGHYKGYKGYHG